MAPPSLQLPSLVALIDRPAREALTRAHGGPVPLVAPALAGLALVSITSLAGLALGGQVALVEPVIRALLEALLLATPVLLVASTFALPTLSPISTLSALAISVGVAGLCAALVLPLLAFLWLCADGSGGAPLVVGAAARMMQWLAAPTVFLIGAPVVLARTLGAFDARAGERLAWLFGALSFSVFLLRLAPHLTRG